MPSATNNPSTSPTPKSDLIALMQQGKSLPERYRFILFEDKREVERLAQRL